MPAVLLTSAGFYGTLAAVRCYGRHGVPVVVADRNLTGGPASWSRFVSKRLRCPNQARSDRFLEWLLQFGRKQPGHVLYPTSDETAWIFSKHRTELSADFRLYQPSVDAIYALLNKRQLDRVGHAEGVAVPRAWFPESEREIQQIAREARFPVLLKPVTQILHATHTKGTVVENPAELIRKFAEISRRSYASELLTFDPSVTHPMVQEFEADSRQVYSLAGFIDESGQLLGVRAAVKLLQRPRRTGVGICFEQAKVDPDLSQAVTRIARRVGYYGVFEVEFIRAGDRYLLIDFNPRFYGQMGFDIARGLPIPMMAYCAATGDHDAMRRMSAACSEGSIAGPWTSYCHRMELEVFLRAQRLSGELSAEEVQYWRQWYASHQDHVVDAVVDGDDWRPIASEVTRSFQQLRHPREFLRSMLGR